MTKKRKLNSNNPKYKSELEKTRGTQILKRIHMCDAVIRDSSGKDTGSKAAVYGVWYK